MTTDQAPAGGFRTRFARHVRPGDQIHHASGKVLDVLGFREEGASVVLDVCQMDRGVLWPPLRYGGHVLLSVRPGRRP